MGFLEALTILFIVLKLCDVISWSWFIVLLPLIIAIIFYIFIFILYVISIILKVFFD